ncbi:hypothetical protein [Mycobacterium talmoniae]|uniref:Uncharacterized protein n=1 Tax=Mycobacterium talmoniae TaxID=1858794 RepID=A0A1S1NDW3_9MYCO|nr:MULTISPECIES: hypothetical protein [Mycobacterium]OHV03866.1 hypothetical protein BKN37_12920 [Mycobacterium talmoniae]PQM45012.1 hypothetical protein C1Y40_04820 [Mycobacterium talmoniae]TDH56235.1 hypothetical protein E2F47_08240 [Mycobacterium eburneum]
MNHFRTMVLWLTIPVNLVLFTWVTFGRGLFGIMWLGWATVFMVVAADPVLLACTTLSTILMFRQPGCPARLTAAQAWLQLACWVCLLLAGVAIMDSVDGETYDGILLSLLGDTPGHHDLSELIFAGCLLGWAVAWMAQLVLLIIGLVRKRRGMQHS